MKRIRRVFAICMVMILSANQYIAFQSIEQEAGQYSTVDTKKLEPAVVDPVQEGELVTSLYAKEAILLDGDTGRVLYEKDGYTRHAMASTTKIMTAIYVIENCDLHEVATASKNAATQPKVHMGVQEGQQYKVQDLLYALMLESFNDCAVILAEHVSGSVEQFCKDMTTKAHELGCQDTSFETPNGLDGEKHYTTPYDLARIAKYALANQTFADIVGTKEYSFSEIHGKRQITVYNKDSFLNQYEGAIGVKTGFTSKAGYCFVGAIKHDGKYLISVVLASGWPPNKSYKWKDTIALMKYGESNYEKYLVVKDQERVGQIQVEGGKAKAVSLSMEGSKEMLLSEKDQVETRLKLARQVEAPVKRGQKVGTLSIYVNGICYDTVDIRTSEKMEKEGVDAVIIRLIHTYLLQYQG